MPGKTFLQSRSICRGVGMDYLRKVFEFRQWVMQSGEDIRDALHLDGTLALYFDKLYFEGYSSQHSKKVAAAIMFAIPEVSTQGPPALVRSRRALRGWARLMPGRQRIPLPWPCLMSMVGSLCSEGEIWHAVAMTIGFVCYLRPGELDQLTVSQLIPPSPGAGAAYQKWGLLLPRTGWARPDSKTRPCC